MKRERRVLLLLGYYTQRLHHGVAAYAHEAGWRLNATMAHEGAVPRDWDCDGIVSMHGGRRDVLEAISASGVPVVDLTNGATVPSLPSVWQDNVAIGRMAGDYLISRGFRDIGYVRLSEEPYNLCNERERSGGLRAAVEAAGRTFHDLSSGRVIEQVRRLPRPLALMAQNDTVGDWLIRALLKEGLNVPEDVAVIGVDTDDIYVAFSPVPQTCVDSNVEFWGYSAATLLDQLMDGKPAPDKPQRIPPVRVIERQSTLKLASDHEPTARAMDYLRAHPARAVSVTELARHAGLSRRQLTEQFLRHVGEPVARYALRLRIEVACQRLAESNNKIEAIAAELGFATSAYFCTVFRKKTGMTPAQFRSRQRKGIRHALER